MKKRASKLDARVDKVAAGFTIIETILFIAIAGLVFTGVIVGTNGAIRRQRYKDTVQSFVDDLRDLYSIVDNTEVLDYGSDTNIICAFDGGGKTESANSGRGRSDCSVYGIVAKLQMNSSASTGTGDNLQADWLIGIDQKEVKVENNATDDISFLHSAVISPYIKKGSTAAPRETIEAKKSSLYWGAQLGFACDDLLSNLDDSVCKDKDENTIMKAGSEGNRYDYYLIIYRSPLTGAIRTLVQPFREGVNLYSHDAYRLYDHVNPDGPVFKRSELKICVLAGDGMSYDGGMRMIVIRADASSANDVVLLEAEDKENTCNN